MGYHLYTIIAKALEMKSHLLKLLRGAGTISTQKDGKYAAITGCAYTICRKN